MFRYLTYPFDLIPDQAKGRTFALPYPFKPLPPTPHPAPPPPTPPPGLRCQVWVESPARDFDPRKLAQNIRNLTSEMHHFSEVSPPSFPFPPGRVMVMAVTGMVSAVLLPGSGVLE